MPGGNGTGPSGRERGSGSNNPGPDGNCVCPNCDERVPHERGIPCDIISCPKCGEKMIRE